MKIAVFLTHTQVECWNFTPAQAVRLEAALPAVEVMLCADQESFLAALPEAQVALIWHFKQEWLEHCRLLEWVVTPAAGRDYFFLPPDTGIDLSYCSFHGEIIAETVLCWLLVEARGFRQTSGLQQAGELWPRRQAELHLGTLRGSRLTILGFGHIGSWIGRLAKPFGVKLTGVKRNLSAVPDYFEADDKLVTLDELDAVLPETDHLVLALPSGEETDNILDIRRLNFLPRGAALYNIGRGNAIDEEALVGALRSGKIRAAYLDVFQQEPLSLHSPLRLEPNFIMLPHASAIAPQYLDLFTQEFIEKFKKRYILGKRD